MAALHCDRKYIFNDLHVHLNVRIGILCRDAVQIILYALPVATQHSESPASYYKLSFNNFVPSKNYICIITISVIIVFPLQAKDAARDGDIASARKSAQNALYCNIASIVCAVIAYISLVVFIPVAVVAANVAVRS